MAKRLKNLPTADNLRSLPAQKLSRHQRRRLAKWGIITGNVTLLLIVAGFVLINRSASHTVKSSTANSLATTSRSVSNPLDQLSSDQIALQAAQMTKMAELTMVRNRADSASALLAVPSNDDSTLAKPQVVSTAQKSRYDIITYRVQRGDNVEKLARKYRVSASSIRNSNDLTGNALTVGRVIYIPPGDGIVYKVENTDTIDSIIDRYQANRNTFITVNDAEGGNLSVGTLVWIPNAVQPVATTTFTPQLNLFTTSSTSGNAWTGGCSPSNGYDCGWCTWWAAHRYNQSHSNNIPSNLGDAYSWAPAAQQQGMTVSFKPRAGSVIWWPGGNHVGFVESVDGDGDVKVSEMNASGWNVVSHRTVPASQAGNYKYIY